MPEPLSIEAVINARGPHAFVVKVAAENNGLGLQRGVAAFDQTYNVVRVGAALLGGRCVKLDGHAGHVERSGYRLGIDGSRDFRRLLSSGLKQSAGDAAAKVE